MSKYFKTELLRIFAQLFDSSDRRLIAGLAGLAGLPSGSPGSPGGRGWGGVGWYPLSRPTHPKNTKNRDSPKQPTSCRAFKPECAPPVSRELEAGFTIPRRAQGSKLALGEACPQSGDPHKQRTWVVCFIPGQRLLAELGVVVVGREWCSITGVR